MSSSPGIHTIRVATRDESDPLGRDILVEIRRTLGLTGVRRVRTVRVFRLEGLSGDDADRLAAAVLAEPVDQVWTRDRPLITDADHLVEVAYRPGVMNPESASILKAAADLGLPLVAADSSREYAFYGELEAGDLDRVLARLLVNPTVEQVVTEAPSTLLIAGSPGPTQHVAIRAMDEAGLLAVAERELHLDLAEMLAIRDYFEEMGRDPTDLELEVLAQTWSEHCVHKTFRRPLVIDGVAKPSLMARLKAGSARFADLVVSSFEDNSGVIAFYEGWGLAGKVETHNSPSAIEPYGGAMTGSGGVFRDVLGTGQGAAVIASTDMFCLAPPDLPPADLPPGCLPPDYLLRKVVAGVRDYGNRMGIPTINGSLHFHRDFRAKPTVIVGAYGLIPLDRAAKGRPQPGDRILVLGGRTGRDGIHGATFSSAAMTARTMEVNATAVQIGNAVEEKRLLDAILACRDAGLIRALTDCGAGGFSSAIGEMGEAVGATVYLDRAPLKYRGLAPWEIFLSESQERMVLAVAPEHVARVGEICRAYNVEATDLGAFEATGRLRVLHGPDLVGELDMAFLHDGLPERVLEGTWAPGPADPPTALPALPADAAAWADLARGVMAHPDVASKEPIVRQYDHTVQGGSALPPFGGPEGDAPSDAAILAPLLGEPYGVVIAHGLNPVLNTFDPYWGGLWAAAEAMANLVAVGGNPREVGLIDNFIWPVPDAPALGALDRAMEACLAVMEALEVPFVSGKDSLSSTYRFPDGRRLEIPPVLCVSAFGRIPDLARTVSSDFKRPGSRLVLVGARDIDPTMGFGLGGSVYLDLAGRRGHHPPRVDLARLPRVLDAVHAAIRDGRVLACHDLSQGGLLAAVAEMGFGGDLGAEIALDGLADRPDAALFNESAGVFLIELPAEEEPGSATAGRSGLEDLFAGLPACEIGRTRPEPSLRFRWGEATLFEVELAALQAAWEAPMRAVFH